ncbi:SWIM zinc finger family protein [Micromonospora tulbaghiae]
MPYDAGRAERDNPRLVGARALVERGAVERDGENATVRTDAETYRVRRHPDGAYSCSCRWWARHRGQRGPCRHALAVSMVAAPVGALS